MGKIKDRRTAPLKAVERAGQKFADDMAVAGIGYAAVFVADGKVRIVEYDTAEGRIVTAVPMFGAWYEAEAVGAGLASAEKGGSGCQFI